MADGLALLCVYNLSAIVEWDWVELNGVGHGHGGKNVEDRGSLPPSSVVLSGYHSFAWMPDQHPFLLDVVSTTGTRTSLQVDDPSTMTVSDLKDALSMPNGGVPANEMILSDSHNTVLNDTQTVSAAKLDALNHRVHLDSPAFRQPIPASTTAEFVGYLVLSMVFLVLLFVFISYSESAYDAAERVYSRLSKRQWREGRPSVLVELVVFFGVLLFFGAMMWQLAAHSSPSHAANRYGTSPVYPNPNDPLKSEHVDVPETRKKKMTTKERILAVVGVIVLVLLIALVAYCYKSKWVQSNLQVLRDHTSNRWNRQRTHNRQRDASPSAGDDDGDDWLSS